MKLKKKISIIVSSILGLIIVGLMIILINNTVATAKGELGSFFGYSIAYVPTESMEPTISAGDTVMIKKCDMSSAKVGDIIIYNNGQRYVIHRVTRILDNGLLKTQGDNTYTNPFEDELDISTEMFFGKYVKTVNLLNLKSIIKNKNFILPLCMIVYLTILVIEGFNIASYIAKKTKPTTNKEEDLEALKERLLQEIKEELKEENNKDKL